PRPGPAGRNSTSTASRRVSGTAGRRPSAWTRSASGPGSTSWAARRRSAASSTATSPKSWSTTGACPRVVGPPAMATRWRKTGAAGKVRRRRGPGAGRRLVAVPAPPPVQMFVPGFTARQLPLDLTNINNVQYRPDGKLVALAYDGNVYLLSDTDGDGLE